MECYHKYYSTVISFEYKFTVNIMVSEISLESMVRILSATKERFYVSLSEIYGDLLTYIWINVFKKLITVSLKILMLVGWPHRAVVQLVTAKKCFLSHTAKIFQNISSLKYSYWEMLTRFEVVNYYFALKKLHSYCLFFIVLHFFVFFLIRYFFNF